MVWFFKNPLNGAVSHLRNTVMLKPQNEACKLDPFITIGLLADVSWNAWKPLVKRVGFFLE